MSPFRRGLAIAWASLAFSATALAADLRIEPDAFGGGASLTHAVPGVTLSLAMADGTVREEFEIFSSDPYGGIPSTGSLVFGSRSDTGEGPQFFYSFANLRADFEDPIYFVSIDFIGCCDEPGFPRTQGLLRAFSAGGELLASTESAVLPRGVVAQLVVQSTSVPIAYVLASTTEDANDTYLDNFVASSVPLPPTAWLLAIGLAGVARAARRRPNSDVRS